ncbi:RHS repeat-associated core domain-containing protein, partial [Mucilaginibacter flavidus]|uniref:RHS repeat-associated core domain-containing protein n=1 Tax=Mucilaginibacter flavidus TaxID=2949309 RepID=UPI0020939DD3
SIARSGGATYRYDYQGAYAEKDPVTGLNNFQLRMYDSKIGRWLSTDPAGQHASPYEGMGNNPVAKGDPTGGEDVNSPIYDRVTGEFLGVDDQGFTGDLLYMDKSVYNLLSNSGGIKIAHAFAETMAEKPSFSSINNSPLIYVFSGITLQALSNSYTDVLAKSGFDVSQLLNGKVSINYHDYNRGIAGNYNNGIDSPTDNATTSVDKRPITVTAQWSTVAAAHDYVKDAAGNEQLTILYTTVENIQNGLGVHELQYHGIKNLRNADHLEIFEAQLRAGSWPGTTNAFKNFILDHYNEIKR